MVAEARAEGLAAESEFRVAARVAESEPVAPVATASAHQVTAVRPPVTAELHPAMAVPLPATADRAAAFRRGPTPPRRPEPAGRERSPRRAASIARARRPPVCPRRRRAKRILAAASRLASAESGPFQPRLATSLPDEPRMRDGPTAAHASGSRLGSAESRTPAASLRLLVESHAAEQKGPYSAGRSRAGARRRPHHAPRLRWRHRCTPAGNGPLHHRHSRTPLTLPISRTARWICSRSWIGMRPS